MVLQYKIIYEASFRSIIFGDNILKSYDLIIRGVNMYLASIASVKMDEYLKWRNIDV